MRLFGLEINRAKNIVPQSKKSFLGSTRGLTLAGDFVLNQNIFYDLYKANGDIRQCVRKISNSVGRNGIYLLDNDDQIVDNAEMTAEAWRLFKTPTWLKFKVDVFRNYLCSGEVYIVPIKNIAGKVVSFQVLDSRVITKKVDKYGNIFEFVASTKTGETKVYTPDQIAFFKLEDDVNNSNNGMGLLHSLIYDGLSDLEASKTNYALYQNSAIPSAMLLLDGDLAPAEMQNAKEQFDLQYKGSENAHKTLVAGGVKDVKILSLTPRDMEFINQRHMTTEKVAAVFGVPKSILGYVDNVNYSNGREQRKEYLEGTIRPYEVDFENMLNKLLQMFVPGMWESVYIKCDGEQLEETQERYEGQRQDIDRGILTINEVRIDRGLEPSKEPNCDKHITSRNAVLLEDIALDAVLDPNEV